MIGDGRRREATAEPHRTEILVAQLIARMLYRHFTIYNENPTRECTNWITRIRDDRLLIINSLRAIYMRRRHLIGEHIELRRWSWTSSAFFPRAWHRETRFVGGVEAPERIDKEFTTKNTTTRGFRAATVFVGNPMAFWSFLCVF